MPLVNGAGALELGSRGRLTPIPGTLQAAEYNPVSKFLSELSVCSIYGRLLARSDILRSQLRPI
jgi:hypothetical protein